MISFFNRHKNEEVVKVQHKLLSAASKEGQYSREKQTQQVKNKQIDKKNWQINKDVVKMQHKLLSTTRK